MAKAKLDENYLAENVRLLIEKLGVSAVAEVSRIDSIFFVEISSEDSSLLIGKYGVLAVRLKSLTGQEDFEIFIDVDGWRRQKEEKLKKMALAIAEKVSTSGRPESLYNLRSSDRRVVHTTLTNHPRVTTLSEGEGVDRYLIIKPRSD